MELQTSPKKVSKDISAQTELDSKKAKAYQLYAKTKTPNFLRPWTKSPSPSVDITLCKSLMKKILAEQSRKDLGPIIDMVIDKEWLSLKKGQSSKL